jgi:hypothetical protein
MRGTDFGARHLNQLESFPTLPAQPMKLFRPMVDIRRVSHEA